MALTNVDLDRIDGNSGSLANVSTSALNGGPLAGTRNRIINGDMRIDQRNAGAAVTPGNGATTYLCDRWRVYKANNSLALTSQRSTTAPSTFTNSLLFSITTGSSPGASDELSVAQIIEGFNIADLGWGTASAQSITLSFWVRSSITGTYAFGLINNGAGRSYIGTYTVNSANTFEYKTITVAGDTSGTWLADNGAGLIVVFDLGSGSNFQGTAGTWGTGNKYATSSSVKLAATTGATFYITGVQLEAGTVATPFERRSYGQELALCQRYYEEISVASTVRVFGIDFGSGRSELYTYAVEKRATPTITLKSGGWSYWNGSSNVNMTASGYETTTKNVTAQLGGSGPGQLNSGAGFTAFSLSASSEL